MITFRFDDTAPDAVAAAEKQAAKLITDITAETELNIRTLIAQAIENGDSPYDAANQIRDLIGLTAAQGQAASKYADELSASGLDATIAEEKVAEYADEMLDVRAENIARYEIMDALNSGQEEAWQQAQDEGLLTDEATKILILSEDACDVCQAVADEGEIPIGDEFDGGDPPIHPRCRCTIGIATP